MAIYDRFSLDGGLTVYGRCRGHGGMPVEVSKLGNFSVSKAPLVYYDPDTHQLNGTAVGRNGFVLLTLDGATLAFDYKDLNGKSLFVERFVGGANGTLQYSSSPPPAGGLIHV